MSFISLGLSANNGFMLCFSAKRSYLGSIQEAGAQYLACLSLIGRDAVPLVEISWLPKQCRFGTRQKGKSILCPKFIHGIQFYKAIQIIYIHELRTRTWHNISLLDLEALNFLFYFAILIFSRSLQSICTCDLSRADNHFVLCIPFQFFFELY